MTREEKLKKLKQLKKLKSLRDKRDQLKNFNSNKMEKPQAQQQQQQQPQSYYEHSSGMRPQGRIPISQESTEGNTAILAGAAEAATVGHVAEIGAGLETGVEFLGGDIQLSSFGDRYISNRNANQKALDDLEAKHPWKYNAANLATHIALAPVSLSKAIGVGVAAGIGYYEPENKSGIITLGEVAKAAGTGLAMEMGGRVAGKALGKPVDWVRTKVGEAYEGLKSGTVAEALGMLADQSRIRLNQLLRRTNRNIDEWSNEMLGMTNKSGDKLLDNKQTYKETYEKILSFQDEVGEDIGKVYDIVSESTPTIKGDTIYSSFKKDHLSEFLTSPHAKMKGAAKKYDDNIYEDFFEPKTKTIKEITPDGKTISKEEIEWVAKDLSISEIQRLKKHAASFGKSKTTGQKKIIADNVMGEHEKYNNQYVGHLTGILEDAVQSSNLSKQSPSIYKKFIGNKRKYGDLEEAKFAVTNTMDKMDSPGIINALKTAINYRGMLIAGGIKAAGVAGTAPSIAIGLAVNKIMNHPATPATMAVQLKKIADAFSKNPHKYERIATAIAQGSSTSSAAMMKGFAYADAFIGLESDPLKRTTDDVQGKRNKLLTVLHNEGLYSEETGLREALNENNGAKVGKILNELSKVPRLRSLFTQGVGWDNKVTSKEEAAAMEKKIKERFSLKKQSELITDLRETGTIPDFAESSKEEDGRIKEMARQKAGKRVPNY